MHDHESKLNHIIKAKVQKIAELETCLEEKDNTISILKFDVIDKVETIKALELELEIKQKQLVAIKAHLQSMILDLE
jgi:predicted RNase H-like nuclease (RuvC/YqgF family)